MEIEKNEMERNKTILESYIQRTQIVHEAEVEALRKELLLQKQEFYEEKKKIILENKEKWDRNQDFFE